MWLARVALLLVSFNTAFGISNATVVRSWDKERQTLASRLLQASGVLSFLVSDPTKVVQDHSRREFLSAQEVEQSQCSAIYFQEPAYFLTAAHCVTENGKRLPFTDYARLFIKGKSWPVDPQSVWVPKEYETSKSSRFDFAVIAIHPSREKEFSDLHDPIPLATQNFGLSPRQETWAVGSGSVSSSEESFGELRAKEFQYTLADSSSQADPLSADHVRPDEAVILFASPTLGINCRGDSGGGVLLEMFQSGDSQPQWYWIGLILGQSSEAQEKGCEGVSRYLVASDLRQKGKLIESAIKEIQEKREKAAKLYRELNEEHAKLYHNKSTLKAPWQELSLERIRELVAPYSDKKSANLKFQNIYEPMQREAFLAKVAAERLLGNSQNSRPKNAVTASFIRAKDPFVPEGDLWREAPHRTFFESHVFHNPGYRQNSKEQPHFYATAVRVYNVGDSEVTFESTAFQGPYTLGQGYFFEAYRRDGRSNEPVTRQLEFRVTKVHSGNVENLRVYFELAPKSLVDYAKKREQWEMENRRIEENNRRQEAVVKQEWLQATAKERTNVWKMLNSARGTYTPQAEYNRIIDYYNNFCRELYLWDEELLKCEDHYRQMIDKFNAKYGRRMKY